MRRQGHVVGAPVGSQPACGVQRPESTEHRGQDGPRRALASGSVSSKASHSENGGSLRTQL